MTRMIERNAGHYEVQETSYGEAYVWCPACVVEYLRAHRDPALALT